MARNTLTHPLDKDITRNRTARNLVFVGTMTLICLFTPLLAQGLSRIFFDGVLVTIGTYIGFCTGISLAWIVAEKFFFIRNNTTGVFVTQDLWAALTGSEAVNMCYGPGLQICFPWERRNAENNISLEEAVNTFEFEVMCTDGTLRVKGSYRLRPDIKNLVAFLSGVASVADEIVDRIKAMIATKIIGSSINEAIRDLNNLNEDMKAAFVDKDHEIETTFGVQLTDVTISGLLPNTELMRTITGLAEAEMVQRGTLILLGYTNQAALEQALKDGRISSEDIRLARDRFLSISGNLDGMEVKRTEFDLNIRGLGELDPEAAKAIAGILHSPAVQAIAARSGSKGGNKSSGAKPAPKQTHQGGK